MHVPANYEQFRTPPSGVEVWKNLDKYISFQLHVRFNTTFNRAIKSFKIPGDLKVRGH